MNEEDDMTIDNKRVLICRDCAAEAADMSGPVERRAQLLMLVPGGAYVAVSFEAEDDVAYSTEPCPTCGQTKPGARATAWIIHGDPEQHETLEYSELEGN